MMRRLILVLAFLQLSVSFVQSQVAAYIVSIPGTPVIKNSPTWVYVFAVDAGGEIVATYNGIQATLGVVDAVSGVSNHLLDFDEGVAASSVSFNAVANGAVLVAGNGNSSIMGYSDPFNIITGPLAKFVISAIASPQNPDTDIPVTIEAQDMAGNRVTSFNGTGALSMIEATSATPVTNAGSDLMQQPFETFYEDSRTQIIYTPSEAGAAGAITAIALDVAVPPQQTLSNFTIRMKHTARADYSADPSWEGSGWTVVRQMTQTVAGSGWTVFQLSTPFAYDGVSNLMVDISYNNSSWSATGVVKSFSNGSALRTRYFSSDSEHGDPLGWSGLSPEEGGSASLVPAIRFYKHVAAAGPTPTATGNFVDGLWSGNFRVPDQQLYQVALRATGLNLSTGISNVFNLGPVPELSITVPGNLAEGQGVQPGAGQVTLNRAPWSPLTVSLYSNDTSEIQVPVNVTIPAGQTSASFDVTVIDDAVIDGTRSLFVSAQAVGWIYDSAPLSVSDNEPRVLSLTVPSPVNESDGNQVCTVSVGFPVEDGMSVTVSNSNPLAGRLSSGAYISAGSAQGSFTFLPASNGETDGSRSTTLTASAAGFSPASGDIMVRDDDLHHFSLSQIPTPQTIGTLIPLSISAMTVDGFPAVYNGQVNLSASRAGVAVPCLPATTSNFSAGTWSGSVSIHSTGSQTMVTATTTGLPLVSANSNLFSITPAQASWFEITGIPSSVASGQLVPVTIRARDMFGNSDPSFNGTLSISLRAAGKGDLVVGRGNVTSSIQPLGATNHDSRAQIIFTAQQMGGEARNIGGMALRTASPIPNTLNNFTVRLKHTAVSAYTAGTSTWESTGWTTVAQYSPAGVNSGWFVIPFSTAFAYNGTSHLMVDISFDNAAAGASVVVRHDWQDRLATLYRTSNSTDGQPLSWSGTTPTPFGLLQTPQVMFFTSDGATVAQHLTTGNFSSAVRTENLTLSGLSAGAVIEVSDSAGRSGRSPAFSMGMTPPSPLTEPAFTGGSENSISWNAVSGATTYEVQAARSPGGSPDLSAVVTGTSHLFSPLSDGTTYHYRVRGGAPDASPTQDRWTQTEWGDFSVNTHQFTATDVEAGAVTLARATVSSSTVVENFDAPGTNWSDVFSDTRGSSPVFERTVLTAGPNTTPPLPVNQGGDKEARIGGSAVYAFTADTSANDFMDGVIEGYFGQETPGQGGVTGLILRGGVLPSGFVRGYLASVAFGLSGSATLSMGVTQGSAITSATTTLGANEIIRLRLAARGPRLTMNAWKVAVSAGVVTETPVLIAGQSSYVIYDSLFTKGRAGIYASSTGTNRMLVDDLSLVQDSHVFAGQGVMITPVIQPPSWSSWAQLDYDLSNPPPANPHAIDVLSPDETVLANNVASGTNLSTLPAVAGVPAIRLRARYYNTGNTNITPALRSWSVSFNKVVNPIAYGAWSGSVASTQDATPPTVAVVPANGFFIYSSSFDLAGTSSDVTSGVATLSVNGSMAGTSNGYANWSRALSGIVNGVNTFSIIATDAAVPPNSRTIEWSLYRVAMPQGDSNGDGINDLLHHGLHLDPLADKYSGLPAAHLDLHPVTGERHLHLKYRRRINPNGFRYRVETTSDLVVWDGVGLNQQVVSTIPTGDGVTELVTIRITPSTQALTATFVRLVVELD